MGRKKGCRVGRFGFSNYTLTPPDGASPGTSAGTEPSDASRVSPQERNLQRKQREIDELRDRLATSQATSTALVAQVQNLTFQVEETKKKLVLSQGAHRQRIHRINNSDSEASDDGGSREGAHRGGSKREYSENRESTARRERRWADILEEALTAQTGFRRVNCSSCSVGKPRPLTLVGCILLTRGARCSV